MLEVCLSTLISDKEAKMLSANLAERQLCQLGRALLKEIAIPFDPREYKIHCNEPYGEITVTKCSSSSTSTSSDLAIERYQKPTDPIYQNITNEDYAVILVLNQLLQGTFQRPVTVKGWEENEKWAIFECEYCDPIRMSSLYNTISRVLPKMGGEMTTSLSLIAS